MIKAMKQILFKYKSILTYGFFGILTTAINVLVYHGFYEYLKLSNLISTVVAWIVSVLFAFITNKLFVFESKAMKLQVLIYEAGKFIGCRTGTGVLELAIMFYCVDIMELNGTAIKIICNVVVIVLNYVLGKVVIFKK